MPSKTPAKTQTSLANWFKTPNETDPVADSVDIAVTDEEGDGRTLPPSSEPDSDLEEVEAVPKKATKPSTKKKPIALDSDDEMEVEDIRAESTTTKGKQKLILVEESAAKTKKPRASNAAPKAKSAKPTKKKPVAVKARPKVKKAKDGSGEESEEPEEEEEESDDGGDRLNKAKAHADDLKLPPLTTMPAIFKDIVVRNPKLKDVADLFKNHRDQSGEARKLRVGTMCSGTESPLLALQLISEAMEADEGMGGRTLNVEHIFSCEIEPFKQAYIERNFRPPILFRDVTELGGDEACVLCLFMHGSQLTGLTARQHMVHWFQSQETLIC
jgi:hypothetical protein